MLKKALLLAILSVLVANTTVQAAPYFRQEADLIPITDSVHYLGTTTPSLKAWRGLIVDELCLTADTCLSAWPSAGSFPFDVQTWGVSTTTTIGFFNGLLSTASSTFTSNTRFPFGIWNSSGNVGIGTTSPGAKLHVLSQTPLILSNTDYVLGSVGTALYTTFGASSGDTYAQMQVYDLGANSSNNLSINPNGGNVGIGTTTPVARLQVAGNSTALPTTNVYQQLDLTGATDPTQRLSLGVLTSTLGGAVAGTGVIQSLTNAQAFRNLSLNPGGGHVGIGTTTPGFALDVVAPTNTVAVRFTDSGQRSVGFGTQGNADYFAFLSGTALSSAAKIAVSGITVGATYDTVSNAGEIRSTANANLTLNARGTGSLILQTADATKLTVTTAGNVGIGTTTPQWGLQVASSTGPQFTLSDTLITANHWSFRNKGGNFYLATSSPSTFATSTTPALSIDTNNILTLGNHLVVLGNSTTTNLFATSASTSALYLATGALSCLGTSATGLVQAGTCGGGGGGNSKFATSTDTNYPTNKGIYPNGGVLMNLGIGTTSPQWGLQIASSTGSQLTLSDTLITANHWSFRNKGGNFFLATSSPSTFATSTSAILSIDLNGILTVGNHLVINGNSTTTNATTTSLFSTTASSTNLFLATGLGCLQADSTGKVSSTGSNCASGGAATFSTTTVQNLATTTIRSTEMPAGDDCDLTFYSPDFVGSATTTTAGAVYVTFNTTAGGFTDKYFTKYLSAATAITFAGQAEAKLTNGFVGGGFSNDGVRNVQTNFNLSFNNLTGQNKIVSFDFLRFSTTTTNAGGASPMDNPSQGAFVWASSTPTITSIDIFTGGARDQAAFATSTKIMVECH